jgi:cytoskeleton protein RodZ
MIENINTHDENNLSLGQQLAQAREAKGLALVEVSDKLKFSVKQLTYLENNQFDQLLSPYLVRAMLRAYAKFLVLSEDPLIAELEKVLPAARVQSFDKQAVAVKPKNVSFSTSKNTQNRFGFKIILVGVLLILLLSLFLWFQKSHNHKSEVGLAPVKIESTDKTDFNKSNTQTVSPDLNKPLATNSNNTNQVNTTDSVNHPLASPAQPLSSPVTATGQQGDISPSGDSQDKASSNTMQKSNN